MKNIVFARTNIEGIRGITPNKMYMNTRWDLEDSGMMYIINDNGYEIFIIEHQCAFLGGKDWEFIKPSELGALL